MIFAIILLVLLMFSLFVNFAQFIARTSARVSTATASVPARRAMSDRSSKNACLKDNDALQQNRRRHRGRHHHRQRHGPGRQQHGGCHQSATGPREGGRPGQGGDFEGGFPGGEVLASDEISKAIAKFQTDTPGEPGKPAKRGKPVVCSMGSLAASGGYYISVPCRWIVANDLTITGSIGVIMHSLELPRADGQGWCRTGDLQERQVQGHAQRRPQHE